MDEGTLELKTLTAGLSEDDSVIRWMSLLCYQLRKDAIAKILSVMKEEENLGRGENICRQASISLYVMSQQ